jgi:hypothetical protein
MAEHTIEEEKIRRFVNTGFRKCVDSTPAQDEGV